MSTMRISRRTFSRYVSHSMIAAALTRVFNDTQAFGATGKKKLIICMNPNGHMNFDSTQATFKSAMSAGVVSKHGLFVKGMKNSCLGGDWHGGEGAFLSFAEGNKNKKASFFSTLGLEAIHLNAFAVPNNYAMDSGGNSLNVFTDPSVVIKSVFGGSRGGTNPSDTAAIEAGKISIIDPCLSDVKSVQKLLGSDGAIFNDYLDALVELDKKNKAKSSDPTGGSKGTPDICSDQPQIPGGGAAHDNYKALLEVIYYIVACDMKQIVTLAFGDNDLTPYHTHVHTTSFQDGGKAYAEFTQKCMSLAGAMVDKLGSGSVDYLQDSAVVYLSEGGAHKVGEAFNPNHPVEDIPCAIFGKMGGAFSKVGNLSADGQGTRNLYRKIVDSLNPAADLSKIDGTSAKPMAI